MRCVSLGPCRHLDIHVGLRFEGFSPLGDRPWRLQAQLARSRRAWRRGTLRRSLPSRSGPLQSRSSNRHGTNRAVLAETGISLPCRFCGKKPCSGNADEFRGCAPTGRDTPPMNRARRGRVPHSSQHFSWSKPITVSPRPRCQAESRPLPPLHVQRDARDRSFLAGVGRVD